MTPELEGALSRFLTGRVCVLGIGNRMWRDDGVGSVTAEALQNRPELCAVDGGMVPENYLEQVISHEPDTVLLLDAADFDGRPGEMRLLEPREIVSGGLSTHAGSPAMLAQYLNARAGIRVGLLAVQSGDIDDGVELSPQVAATMRDLVETLPAIVARRRA